MIILKGKLRQSTTMTLQEKLKTKLWIEHETPRDNGVADLRIEELFLEGDVTAKLPKPGENVGVIVRPYPSGRDVRYAATGIATA
jgi:hypothetical protein